MRIDTSQVQIASGGGTVSVGARLGSYSSGVPGTGYVAEIASDGTVTLWRVDTFASLGTYTIPSFSLGTWYTLALRANGSSLSVEVNGSAVIGPVTNTAYSSGEAGLWSYEPTSVGSHRFDNFSVTLLGGGSQGDGHVRAKPVVAPALSPLTQSGVVSTTIAYTYDALYRLTSASYSDGAIFTYAYDAVGNRTSATIYPGVVLTYTYDAANRLTNAGGVTYSWDANGNLRSHLPGVTYQYDAANRLIAVDDPVDPAGPHSHYTFRYNGMGDRTQQTTRSCVGVSCGQTLTATYTLDLNLPLTQVLADGANSYLYGVSRIGEQQPGGWVYHLPDALGSVRQLTDATGRVTSVRSYDPYGRPRSVAGSGVTTYGFTGEAGVGPMYYLRARYYHWGIGRFMSRDTWEGDYAKPLSLNRWSYVNGNPVNYTDPSGRCVFFAGLDTAGCVAAWTYASFVVATLVVLPYNHSPEYRRAVDGLVDICEREIARLFRAPQQQVQPYLRQNIDVAPQIPPVVNPDPERNRERNPISPYVDPGPGERAKHEVLIVGESDQFRYSLSLHAQHPEWEITGTSYGQSNLQDIYRRSGNLTLVKNVDATRLGAGTITGNNKYHAIIFNNPLAKRYDDAANAALIRDFIASARARLTPGGAIHINVTQEFLKNYARAAQALGVADNSPAAIRGLPRFGTTMYFAPYIPQYSDGGDYPFESTYDVQYLKNFIFR